ncbi:MAG: hypothetical protein ABIB43_04520 [archaeon]
MKKMGLETYVITAFQAKQRPKNADKYGIDYSKGAPNRNLIRGLEEYCEKNSAKIMYLSMDGMDASEPARKFADRFFKNNPDVYYPKDRNIKLNKNCIVSDDIVPPQNMDPATSRDRIVQADQTRIYAHSKQRLKSIAAGNGRLPKLLITTGACTHPNYNTTNHKGDMAKKEHKYGAVVVEVIDKTYFNVRHMPAMRNGTFVDVGNVYNGSQPIGKANVESITFGDIHWGDHDSYAIQANDEMIKYFKPKRLFLHDFVNGHSVNPHERDNLITRIQAFEQGRLDIKQELSSAYEELVRIAKNNPEVEINVVYSNHGFFIDRYLESGRFIHEPWNGKIAFKLADAMVMGQNPVEIGLNMMGKIPPNVRFLKLRDDYKVWGWQLASHGHKGISGARGNVKSAEVAHGKSITGHTHAPEIMRNTVIVGTSTRLDLPYTDGSSSRWLAANAVLYEGGLVQLLPSIKGKWLAGL